MIFNKIQEIIAEELDKDLKDITLETNLEEDLEADSLDVFQVINEIEEEFDIEVDTSQNIKTVSDLVQYVEEAQK